MKQESPVLVWFRSDLRLADNPALERAVEQKLPVIAVFIWAPENEKPWVPGAASNWWLHQSLRALGAELQKRGSRLIIRRGRPGEALHELAAESGAGIVCWNRRYEPSAVAYDKVIEAQLLKKGLAVEVCRGNVLFEPGSILTSSRQPYRVFTPFWRACLEHEPPEKPSRAPASLQAPAKWPATIPLDELKLEPEIDWTGGIREAWQPGEAGAAAQLKAFAHNALADYSTGRDQPDHTGTSRLSPHLHFGEVSIRQIWHALNSLATRSKSEQSATQIYLREIGWREFSYHMLFYFPFTSDEPLHGEFRAFAWRNDPRALNAWHRGKTGYPMVDAGMRELWHTGWMHNRVRMIAASFLIKHLLIDWREGAQWFWDTLVDADLANNTMGWQWTAGSGADAAPFFRIFNPVLQGEKFDPKGDYVRRWIPELARLSNRWIHQPWNAPSSELTESGIDLGKTYPKPIVEHEFARRRALAALETVKAARQSASAR